MAPYRGRPDTRGWRSIEVGGRCDGSNDNLATGSFKVHVTWGEREDVANETVITRILHRLGGIVGADMNECEIEAHFEKGGVVLQDARSIEAQIFY
jgi:hypothetical protein